MQRESKLSEPWGAEQEPQEGNPGPLSFMVGYIGCGCSHPPQATHIPERLLQKRNQGAAGLGTKKPTLATIPIVLVAEARGNESQPSAPKASFIICLSQELPV